MEPEARQQLRKAYQLVKAKRKAEARAILEEALTANPRLVDAYYVYSLAAATPDEAREALRIALEINPAHARAQRALARLNARYPTRAHPPEPAIPVRTPSGGIAPLGTSDAAAPTPTPAALDDDEPPDTLFSLADDVAAEDEDKPASAADIKLTAAGRAMNLPVKSLMIIGVSVVVLATVVLIVLVTLTAG